MKELKRTSYNHFKAVVIGSRDQLCINSTLKGLSNTEKTEQCKLLRKEVGKIVLENQKHGKTTKSDSESKESLVEVEGAECKVLAKNFRCKYFKDMTPENFEPQFKESVMDIEDLKKAGKTNTRCPYFAAKRLAEQAQVIFMPYNVSDQ